MSVNNSLGNDGFPTPVGTILPFFGKQANRLPSAWLYCAGQELVKTDYPELYATIGDDFNLTTTTTGSFCLPQLALGDNYLYPSDETEAGGDIPSKSLNPIAEHTTDVLDRTGDKEFGKSDVGQEKLPTLEVKKEPTKIGSIFSRKGIERMTKRGLKDIIKALPKVKDGFKLVGAGKPQLVDYICKRCGK